MPTLAFRATHRASRSSSTYAPKGCCQSQSLLWLPEMVSDNIGELFSIYDMVRIE